MNNLKFKYFSNPIKNAEFTDIKCQICGTNEYCLEGEYFDCGDDIISVCLNCLSDGKEMVNVPEFIEKRLEKHLKAYENLSDEIKLDKKVKESMEELKKNPPVPWIQYNDWQVCCGDFVRYIGEWDKDEINKNALYGNGKKYILSILDEFSKGRIDDVEEFWDGIGVNTIIFTFKCIKCSKIIAVCQSY